MAETNPNQDYEKGLKFIVKIFRKIINEPNNSKYQSLNYKKVINKLKNCKDLIDLLYNAGFSKSDDRLLFDINLLHTLKMIYDQLLSRR